MRVAAGGIARKYLRERLEVADPFVLVDIGGNGDRPVLVDSEDIGEAAFDGHVGHFLQRHFATISGADVKSSQVQDDGMYKDIEPSASGR
jgi:hypothetical protein